MAKDWSVPEHYRLGEADQKNWLTVFGDPQPLLVPDLKSIRQIARIKVCGYPAEIIQAAAWTHSDISSSVSGWPLKLLMSGMANIMKFSKSSLSLSGNELLPNWKETDSISNYEKIYISGYFIIVNISPLINAILYGNGTSKTLPKIKTELLSLMKSFRIEKV